MNQQQDRFGQFFIFVGVGLITLLSLIIQMGAWQFNTLAEVLLGIKSSVLPPVLAAVVAGGVIWLYGRLWANRPKRLPRYRAVLETWSLAALFQLLLIPLRMFLPSEWADAAVYAHLIRLLALSLFWLLIVTIARRRGISEQTTKPAGAAPWLVAGVVMFLWFWVGSFGSFADAVADVVLGLLFGLVVAKLIGTFLLPPLFSDTRGAVWDRWLSAWAIGGVLAIMGSAFSMSGQLMLLGILLPALAWPLAGLLERGAMSAGQNVPTIRWLVGLVTAIVFMSADSDELSVLLSSTTTEPFYYLQQLSFLSAGLCLLMGVIIWLLQSWYPTWREGRIVRILTIAVWAGAVVLLIAKPNRGFHGDDFLIVFEAQADVSQALDIEDIDERRAWVYETQVAHADATQQGMRRALDVIRAEYQPYYLVNGISVRGGSLMQRWLGTFAGVDRILSDPLPRPAPQWPFDLPEDDEESLKTDAPPDELPWGIRAIEADRVWQEFGVRGAGIVVGESDSGVQWDHPELQDSYRGAAGDHAYNWLDPWNHQQVPYDPSGHGTHTTATVVGNNVGVAPDAEWFGCANLIRDYANPSFYLDCMQFMLAPHAFDSDPLRDGEPSLAADVMNNSWACPLIEGCDAESLQAGVEALRAAGIFVVASAGNEGRIGCETVSDPIAIYDASFTVGATNEDGTITEFSSRGPVSTDGSGRLKPDIVAPGGAVISAIPGNLYDSFDGTSMAGPHVAGVVALMWSANPSLIGHIERTEEIMIETATPVELTAEQDACGNPHHVTGFGLVNAYEAVKMALGAQ